MENPKCPYCGGEMEYYWDNNPMMPQGRFFCPKCHSQAPTAKTEGEAYAAAMKREKKCKTYAEDFFEKFPNAEPKYYDGRGKEQMIPIPCRQHCYGVVGQKCNGIGCSCSACWNEVMEDEDE